MRKYFKLESYLLILRLAYFKSINLPGLTVRLTFLINRMKSVIVSTICIISLIGLTFHPIQAARERYYEFKKYLTPYPDTTKPEEKIRLPKIRLTLFNWKTLPPITKDVIYDEKSNRYIMMKNRWRHHQQHTHVIWWICKIQETKRDSYFNDLQRQYQR